MTKSAPALAVCITLTCALLGLPRAASGRSAEPLRLLDLRCEYRTNPLGLDATAPRLSWVLASGRRGERQTAYQVLVASSPERLGAAAADLWDSGKVASDQTTQVLYAGRPLTSRMRCYWKVRVWDRDGQLSAWSEPASWTMGLLQPTDWQAQWLGSEEGRVPVPADAKASRETPLPTPRYLRKEFHVAGPVRRATVYVTALGLYELRLNGRRVGDHLLAPEWTSYSHRVQVDALDVTDLIRRGDNALGAMVGNGWYCGMFMCWPQRPRLFGDRPWLLAQLEIETMDGHRQVVATDTTWRVSTAGPLRQSGIYEGETYDARLEMPGWDAAGFNDAAWSAAVAGTNLNAGKLVWQRSEPIRVTDDFRPVSLTEPKPGVYVFDLGQNIAGWCRCTVQGPAGSTVTLRHAEALNRDGTVYTANLRGARAIDQYTLAGTGRPETFEPHFTYHGFRYVELTGLPTKPARDAILGRMFHTSSPDAGTFECSQPLLNRLAQNIRWSQRANYMGVPTDCPNRDERTGCTGDHQLFMPTAVYLSDVAAFFNKWLVDLCEDAQSTNGVFADVAPYYGMWPGLSDAWGDAGIICPYVFYRTYGDTQLVAEHYAAMRRHHAYLVMTSTNYLRDLHGPGDWLNLGGTARKEVIATAYFAGLTGMMAEMAQALGRDHEAAEYRALQEKIKAAFRNAFIKPDGSIAGSSQTGYALAFTLGLVPPELRPQMVERFVAEIERFKWHPAVGFIGLPRLLPGLHEAGRDDVAYRLLCQETYPSWLFMVKNGATTMWERWDSFVPGKGFQDPGMNSFNHVVWGGVGEYLYGMVGGIRAEAPGYKVIRIQPVAGPEITWARTSYQSIRGRIATSWNTEAGRMRLQVTIPPNTTALVFLPVKDPAAVTESGKPASQAAGVKFLRLENGAAVYAVESGSYSFGEN